MTVLKSFLTIFLFSVILSLWIARADAISDYNKGVAAYKQGNHSKAAKWYRKAADQGYATAQLNLGYMYGKGLGVLKDNILAHMWFNIAAIKGHKMGKRYRGIVEKRMTAAEIFKAMKKAKRCFKSSYKDCG